ncbi:MULTISPECIES: tol-pal system protein YbgF [Shewanella]|jgi:tol-pal system protein YbgF|uniref:Cell division coordinator CpoB n=1 Tax=Shewanella psychromarinicola TaxID=2487742 RepID=A0A3N4DKW1_9GAMM|nr:MULTISPECIES: tol-pal system protein YbgF [Shewanella]AZG35836.1 tol-pal system protein YbgF [Shewanella psychromarinicola]MCL1083653.1 tol-pal system protein YbgF [Shewanella psychromarinicola]PKG77141.1 tol-pal system protein YbgF [Shewanella sp. Actino-trap-3]RPA22821.1 tol-pal system protein YbgF [Shewanella psychromarinicola]|tara:strand:+ start:32967 stop:33704 length:738 start_codon:yes stop_codon:yes gene_type:complete
MKQAILVAAMFFTTATVLAAPAPVEDVAGGSNDDRVSRLERIMKAKQQGDFEMQRRMDVLQNEVLDLRGITEQQNYQMNQMLQRQRQLYEDIANLTAQSSTPAAPVQADATSVAAASSTLGETGSYEAAVNLVLKERKYDEAIPAFRNFIAKYPESNYAANANYWLGQLLYNKNEFSDAKQAFSTVVSQFADSNKRGDSLVKLGMIAEEENDLAGAKALYNKVIKEYADSASARLAQQQLLALKG